MTEDEKELEEKMKQYKYEIEENKKKMETLQQDLKNKKGKKSFIFRMNRTIGRIVFIWAGIGFIVLGLLLYIALSNYIGGLQTFDPVIQVEERYNMNLKTISRNVDEGTLYYKVKPKKWKYRKIEFSIVREGRGVTYDDFQERYLKYIIDNIEDKSILNDFEIIENYQQYDILEYKVVYNNENTELANEKIQNLINYVKEIDTKNIIYKLNQMIIKESKDEQSNISFRGWSNEKSLYFWSTRCVTG